MSKSDEEDWDKLKRVLTWLSNTIEDVRTMGVSSLSEIFTWVDAAYAVHVDMRSHTGGLTSMGHGVVHTKSSKQKLNTKSSTEAELVGVSEYLPYNIWTRMFLEAQDFKIRDNVIFQDNKSAMLMQNNGWNSCTGNSQHINMKYFFVKDRIDKKEVQVEYCSTHHMLADFYTKPLQVNLFQLMREVIMGMRPMIDLHPLNMPKDEIKERVGNCVSNHGHRDTMTGHTENQTAAAHKGAELPKPNKANDRILPKIRWKKLQH